MRVCLDARGIKRTMTGHGRYERELIRAIARIDRDNEYIVVLNNRLRERVIDQENFLEVRLPGRQTSLTNLAFGAKRIERIDWDVFHSLHQFLPRAIRGRTVVTLHDLFRIEHPNLIHSGILKRAYTRGVQVRDLLSIPYALRRADHVISISQYTADRANQRFGIDPRHMTVVPHGVAERFLIAGSTLREGRQIADPPFFLMLGDSTRHKNVHGAIEALAILGDRRPELELHVVGNGSEYGRLRRMGETFGVGNRVKLFSQVSDDEVIRLMQTAVGFVFPSLLEGFGLPILEAQAVGCPVIVSNIGAPAEVAGEAAIHVDPYDATHIADAMDRLHTDRDFNRTLGALGREHALEYTWTRAAVATIDVYKRVMGTTSTRPEPVRQPAMAFANS